MRSRLPKALSSGSHWMHSVPAVFCGSKALPVNGSATLVLERRRSSTRRLEVQLSFDNLAQ